MDTHGAALVDVVPGHIPLQGAKNLRDFGGYTTRDGRRVKRGKLFRSDSLSCLTEDDLHKLDKLGILAVCDLRRSQEKARSPSRWIAGALTVFHHLPFFHDQATVSTGNILRNARALNSAEASRGIMLEVYKNMVTESHAVAQIARIFQLLTDRRSLPILLHCSGGKDRTGVSCALILTLLGVSREDVIIDYMHSLELYTKRTDLGRQSSGQVYDSEKSTELSEAALWPVYAVEPAYLASAFEAITATYGNIDLFFRRGLNLSEEDLARINDQLLE